MPTRLSSHRPTLLGSRFMAASTHYHASQAAARIFASGGNAIDAGVAAGLTLAVVEPHRASLGGVVPILIRTARGTTHCIVGLGPWPKRATIAEVTARWGGDLPEGIARTVVPAALSAYLVALEHFGTLPFGVVAAPARELAWGGFPVYPLLNAAIAAERSAFDRWPSSCRVFLPEGRVPRVGEILRQTDLAQLLDLLSEAEQTAGTHGREAGLRAAHDRFYRGDIAEQLAAFSRAEGGLLDVDDLVEFRAPVEDPVRISFHDHEVLESGPWSQGPALLQALKILEPYGAEAFDPGDPRSIHLRIEALKLAFADREAFYGDPSFVSMPINRLLSADYAAQRRAQIDGEHASSGLPAPGNPWSDQGTTTPPTMTLTHGKGGGRADTTYVATGDVDGNVFSATPSDPAFWSPLVPGLGIILSARGAQTWLQEDHPSSLRPGKRPRLTPNPALVLRDGKPLLALGTPGGDVQCQAMLQVLGAVVERDWDLQAAIEAPRAATYAAPNSFWPHQAEPGVVRAESRLGAHVLADLRRRGHAVEAWPAWEPLAGAVCAVQFLRNGMLAGGADPRRASYAIGW